VSQDPFPSPGWDGEEPDGSVPPPAAGNAPGGPGAGNPGHPAAPGSGDEWPGDDPDAGAAAEQGLFVCLPAEDLDVSRFAQHGRSDSMPPGPLLASVVHALTGDGGDGLAALSDDQLVGIIAAARRLESRVAWTQLAALAEFAARRPAHPAGRNGGGARPGQAGCEFAADELAAEQHLTWQSAAGQIDYACTVADRLPRTFAALAAGTIHPVHVRIIEDETSVLSAERAARADAVLAGAAESKTFGQLRGYAHRLVLKLDPDAARKRKEAARREAHVRRFREGSGNAGMVARELPPDEVLASWQHVEQRALDLRAAGLPGTLRELRVRAYLDLLQERDSRLAPAAPGTAPCAAPDGPYGDSRPAAPPDGTGGSGSEPGEPGGNPGGGAGPGSGPQPDGPAAPAGTGPDIHAGKNQGPAVAALVNITVPWSAWTGQSDTPGEAAGFGLLDADTLRDLLAAAARDPRTRWCVTALHPDGTAAAHGCASGRHHPPPGTGQPAATPGPDPPPGTSPRDLMGRLRIQLTPIARGACGHDRAEPGYRPSRKLQHLVRARSTRCTAPGCGRPAARCDLDHTIAWDQGGLTCECDLAPWCKR
jgi:Domain of unknown function (DUF222)